MMGETKTKAAIKAAVLTLDREEGAALISATHVILLDMLSDGTVFPVKVRPLFRVYCKLCALWNLKADMRILQAAMLTWA